MGVAGEFDGDQTGVVDIEERTQCRRQIQLSGAQLQMFVDAGHHVIDLHIAQQRTCLLQCADDTLGFAFSGEPLRAVYLDGQGPAAIGREIATLTIYYVTPWLRWDRGPYAPDQAVLVDIANRRFYMFGIEIWPHEFYFVAGLLIMAGIGLFLVTSAVGRAWCGYTCPQTVWTDLFQHVDRLIDGLGTVREIFA